MTASRDFWSTKDFALGDSTESAHLIVLVYYCVNMVLFPKSWHYLCSQDVRIYQTGTFILIKRKGLLFLWSSVLRESYARLSGVQDQPVGTVVLSLLPVFQSRAVTSWFSQIP